MRFTRLGTAAAALAVASGGLVAPAASGSPADAALAAPYHVTLKLSAKEAVAKQDKVKLKGTVVPRPPAHSEVVVQAKYEDSKAWKRVGTAPVRADGTYVFTEKPGTRLDRTYRVVKKTDGVATVAKSRERNLNVIKWDWLTRLVPSAGENFLSAAVMPINGDDYSHTLYGDRTLPSGFREFTLGRDCETLEVTFGLSDRTETGGRATLQLMEDGVVSYNRTFDLGQSEPKSIDVTGVFRIRFDYAQVADTPATEPSLGAGRVLCD
jgi:hypothetical protein